MGFAGAADRGHALRYYLQNTEGLIVTGLTSQIHDGLYLANLVFLVGVAAGAVTIVFPAYVYHHEACTRSPCSARCWRFRP
jgi:molybdopterin-containing oxidoreductase family membrane subunit